MNTNKINLLYLILLSWMATCITTAAKSQDIFIDPDANGNLTITWTIPACVTPKPGWEDEFLVDQPFQFKFKKESALGWEGVLYSDGTGVFIPATDLDVGFVYKFKVKYYGRNADCRGLTRVRTLAKKYFHYNVAIFNETQIFPGKSKKIHGEAFDKCLYPYTWPGGSIDSVRMFHWGCYNQDIKAFIIETAGGSLVKMKNQMLNLCIVPTQAFFGDTARVGLEMGVGSCDLPNAFYEVQPVDAFVFKLVNAVNGRCLVPSGAADGAMLFQSPCLENDDRQNFYFEDF